MMRRGRWRTWLRVHTPTALYDRGLVIPKVRDCGHHEWYRQDEGTEACYHCRATRVRPGTAEDG
jgi:hypothetical protein